MLFLKVFLLIYAICIILVNIGHAVFVFSMKEGKLFSKKYMLWINIAAISYIVAACIVGL